MLLTDIAVEHTLVSKKNGVRQTFLLHPFTNTQRDTLGKFEIVRDIREPGFKEVRRSAFVTFQQLAERLTSLNPGSRMSRTISNLPSVSRCVLVNGCSKKV